MSENDDGGTWRRYQHIMWSDVLVPFKAAAATLVLLVAVIAVAAAVAKQSGAKDVWLLANIQGLGKTPAGVQGLTAISDVIMLFYTWQVARRTASSAFIARFQRVSGRWIGWPMAGGAVMAGLVTVMIAELERRGIMHFRTLPAERLIVTGFNVPALVTVATTILIAPLAEEYYFRGILFSWLGRKMPVVLSALVSAAVFGLVHLRFVSYPGAPGWTLTGVIALLGLISAMLAVRARSLWPSFALHASYNAVTLAVSVLARAIYG